MNATLSTNEKGTEASPLSKRAMSVSSGVGTANRAAGGSAQTGETFINVAVHGATGIDASATQAAQTQAPDPTAARQAVRVEILLATAMSAGESIRPNGSNQLEMRVRLDGGDHDVTVRLQVADDRMQVTFQTNSPELRKALEHGWQQFSADAAQNSTLATSEPHFETARANAAPQSGQADAPSFSSGQQNSRRQETAPQSADDLAPLASSRPTRPATTSFPGQPAVRRWSGWA